MNPEEIIALAVQEQMQLHASSVCAGDNSWTQAQMAPAILAALKAEGFVIVKEVPAWKQCRKGSCHRHETCTYTPCWVAEPQP